MRHTLASSQKALISKGWRKIKTNSYVAVDGRSINYDHDTLWVLYDRDGHPLFNFRALWMVVAWIELKSA